MQIEPTPATPEPPADTADEPAQQALEQVGGALVDLALAIAEQPAPAINIAPAAVNVEIALPEQMTHAITHKVVHEVPGLAELARATERGAQASQAVARELQRGLAQQSAALDRGLNAMAHELGKPTEAVLDEDGNVVGAVRVEQLKH